MKKSAPYSVVIRRVNQILGISKEKVGKQRGTYLLPTCIPCLPFSTRV